MVFRLQIIGRAFSTANGSGAGLSQASNVVGVPLTSLKRRAMQPAPRVQRRKITLPPPVHPYILSSQVALAPPPHIKWKGIYFGSLRNLLFFTTEIFFSDCLASFV